MSVVVQGDITMEARMKMSKSFMYPQCPMLDGTELLVGPGNCETIVDTDVLESSSYIVTDDVCALSYTAPTHLQSGTNDSSFYWCNVCSFNTQSKTSLMEHVTTHRFRCQNCQFNSYSRARVVQHVLSEHHQVISDFRNFSYCTLVQSKAVEPKRKAWHKPCSSEMEDGGTEIGGGNKLKVCSDSISAVSNSKSTEDKIYIHFKKAYFNRPIVDESVSERNDADSEASVTESNIQLPVSESKCISLNTCEGMNTESTETVYDLEKDLAMSQTQMNFSVHNTVLTLVSHSKNKPLDECLQDSQINDNNLSFQTVKRIKRRCIQSQARSTNYDTGNVIQPNEIGSALSCSTVVNGVSPLRSPVDEWKQYDTVIPQSTAQCAVSGNGRVKYIYGAAYEEITNQNLCPSDHSSELKSASVKMDVCTISKNSINFSEDTEVFSNVCNNYLNASDTVIKTEPIDAESQSFSPANCDYIVSSNDVQHPVDKNIHIKKEIPGTGDESECLHLSAFGIDSADELSAAKRVCQDKYKAVDCHVSGGRNELVTNQVTDSSRNDSSSMPWDCGQCDFQSAEYETCRRHIRTIHFAENNSLCCSEKGVSPVALKVPRDTSIIRDLLEEGSSLKLYSCRTCNYVNPASDAVKTHNREHHLPSLLAMYSSNTMVFYCPEQCDYLSDDRADYLSHVKRCRGSLIGFGNSKTSSVLQASLMLTLRHIFNNDKSGMKRMFMCASCDFETDILADITAHTVLHSDNRQVAIKRDNCRTKVSWICLKCQILIKLMQLKKHQCPKMGILECSDLACSQCHSGKRKCTYVCDKCKYETGCLLMIMTHQSNVCKSGFKEIEPDGGSVEGKLCSRCNSAIDDGDVSHVCITDSNKRTVGTQSKYNTRRVTRSVSKISCISNVDATDNMGKDSVSEFTEEKSCASEAVTESVESKSKRAKKRKRTGSPKQIQSTPVNESAEKKTEKSINAGLAGGTDPKSRGNDISLIQMPRIDVHSGSLNVNDAKPSYFKYRFVQRCLTPQDYRHQMSDSKIGNRPDTSVPSQSWNVCNSTTSETSRLAAGSETVNGIEVAESEFKPLSMLEWLNTESQRMLKLLKP